MKSYTNADEMKRKINRNPYEDDNASFQQPSDQEVSSEDVEEMRAKMKKLNTEIVESNAGLQEVTDTIDEIVQLVHVEPDFLHECCQDLGNNWTNNHQDDEKKYVHTSVFSSVYSTRCRTH